MRRKGFTLVELLVVIAIIAMLLAILMPALAKVKTLAYQMLCGTNLKGIANAILVYGQDNNEKYPVAGNPNHATVTGRPNQPTAWRRNGNHPNGSLIGGSETPNWQWDDPDRTVVTARPTVSACLYLLVKYADVSPASFICKAGKQKKLNLATITASGAATGPTSDWGNPHASTDRRAKDPTECWDFSNAPSKYCSYSYAYPWDTTRQLSSSSKSGMAVAADLNPWIQGETPGAVTFVAPAGVYPASVEAPQLIGVVDKLTWPIGNSITHEQAGQNIMFNDMHVEFTKNPNPDSAVQNDNIYTTWNTGLPTVAVKGKGRQPENTGNTNDLHRPVHRDDSYLVQW